MVVSLIAAMGENRVIGIHNKLPWHLPADLRRFRHITMGKPILMGRKTFESIGKALPGRTNIVVTRAAGYRAEGCIVASGIDDALTLCRESQEVMVIGGASLYEQMLMRADRMYLTLIHEAFPGDTVFPPFDASEWRETDRLNCDPDHENPFSYSFVVLRRVYPAP